MKVFPFTRVLALPLVSFGLIFAGCGGATPSRGILNRTATANTQTRDKAKDKEEIEKTFSQYKSALLEGNGTQAADMVDARTISHYDEMAANALKLPRQDLAKLDFMSKFTVLRVRHEFDKAQIEKMTGRDLFVIGVEKGWISKSTVSNIGQLANIKVDETSASASLPQAPNVAAFHFLNESGQWKLALWQSFELANFAMQQEVSKSGLTEDEFILRVLDALSSKKVNRRILSGPLE